MLDSQGNLLLEDNDIIELMLSNRQVKILPSNKNNFDRFESECKKYGLSINFKQVDRVDSIDWQLPDEYKNLDIRKRILQYHDLNHEQLQRVNLELELFNDKNLMNLLRFLCYFIDVVKSNNIVYGVGRGSSIASYVLYLIGIHRINSLKYNLDIKEFLK